MRGRYHGWGMLARASGFVAMFEGLIVGFMLGVLVRWLAPRSPRRPELADPPDHNQLREMAACEQHEFRRKRGELEAWNRNEDIAQLAPATNSAQVLARMEADHQSFKSEAGRALIHAIEAGAGTDPLKRG